MPDQERPNLEAHTIEIPGFVVLNLIGEGGFGEVYRCREQEGLKRDVAIKVIRLGMGTREILARFDAEMHALARMDSENVARVIGSGATGDGRPYFVMEYIPGVSLSRFIEEKKPTLDERLHLFQQICTGVQHAHSKGIIHRDLKPGNIVITEQEGNLLAKVIDFGLAKALSDPLTDRTLMTGTQYVLGSWDFISPEQAISSGADVDIRSDVYSLGAVLYSMLTSTPPHGGLGSQGQTEILRRLEEDSPPRPSQRLDVMEGTFRENALGALRSELDWIVLKALEVEPERRYPTVQALSDDISRHLAGNEPIVARPPSAGYQLLKLSRKHRSAITTVGLVFIALIAGISWALSEREEAIEQKNLAQQRTSELEELAQFQSEQLGALDAHALGISLRAGLAGKLEALARRTGNSEEEASKILQEYESLVSGADFTGLALESLDTHIFKKTEEAIDEEFTDQPLLRARLLHTLGKVMFLTGLLERAVVPAGEALRVRRDLLEEGDPQILRSKRLLGQIFTRLGRFPEALTPLTEAFETSRRLHGPDNKETIESMSALGDLEARRGNLPAAEELLTSAFEGSVRSRDEKDHDTYLAMGRLGWLLAMRGDFERAEKLIRQSIEGFRTVVGNDHRDTQSALTILGNLLGMQGRYEEITPYFEEVLETRRRILGDQHTQTLMAINNMGHLLHRQGNLDQAVILYQESLDGFRRNLGDIHHDTMLAANNLGVLLMELGELEKSEPYLLEAREVREQVLGLDHVDTQTSRNDVGFLRLKQGDFASAEKLLLSTHRWLLNHHGPGHLIPFETLDRLRILYEETNEPEAATELYSEILDPLIDEPTALSPMGLQTLTRFGALLLSQEKYSQASECLAPAEASIRKTFSARDPLLCGEFLQLLSRSLLLSSGENEVPFSEIETKLLDGNKLTEEKGEPSQLVSRSIQRTLVELYSKWHESNPGSGYDGKSNRWQATLSKSLVSGETEE